jgi:peptidylprolyl isomerase
MFPKISSYLFVCTFILSVAASLQACSSEEESKGVTYVEVQTDLGNITLKLYDETPIHKKNFIKLVEERFYDGVAFHRIVPNFMIQAGDPSTKEDTPDAGRDPGYSLKAEISTDFVHTAGKLAAARDPDDVNPEKRSSGSQFFIVTGKPVTYSDLEATSLTLNNQQRAKWYEAYQQIEQDPYNPIDFETFLASKGYEDKTYYDREKVNAYARLGGSPHLDFQYTIFGEVVLGMEVVRRIEQIPTEGDRPLKTVRIQSMRISTPEAAGQTDQES